MVKEKKESKIKFGKSSRFSAIFWGIIIFICVFAIIFNKKLTLFVNDNFKFSNIDKIAILAIAAAINICIATSLTLSLTIENGVKHKLGLSPKEFNEFLGYPISLYASFTSLVGSSAAMIVFAKFNWSAAFFLTVVSSLAYFFVSIIKALPVLSVDIRLWYKVLYSALSEEVDIEDNSFTFRTLSYLFDNKIYLSELYKNISSGKTENLEKVQTNLFNFFYTYIKDCTNKSVYVFYAKQVSEFIYDIPRKTEKLSLFNNEMDLYYLFYELSKNEFSRHQFNETLFYNIFKYADAYKNKENYICLRDIYLHLVANAFQTNNLDLILSTKKFICSYNFCDLYDKKSVTLFLVISFLMYSYCVDAKVPKEYKDNLLLLKDNEDNGFRSPKKSWASLFCSLLESEKEIDKDEFISIFRKFEFHFEYSIYGVAYTPIITVGNALFWIWSVLLSCNEEITLDKLIDRKNDTEIYSFKRYLDYDSKIYFESFKFFGKIVDGKTKNQQLISDFEELYNSINKKRQEHDIQSNSIGKREINNLIKKSLIKELKPLINCTNSVDNRLFTTEQFPMEFLYENSIEAKLNANVITYNSESIIKHTLLKKLNISKINEDELEKRLTDNSLEIKSINQMVLNYIKYGYFKKYEKYFGNIPVIECPLINIYPTCFTGLDPLITKIKINVSNCPISKKNLFDLKEQFRTNNGGYQVRNAIYNESGFVKFANKNFIKVKINVEITYSFEDCEILEIDTL